MTYSRSHIHGCEYWHWYGKRKNSSGVLSRLLDEQCCTTNQLYELHLKKNYCSPGEAGALLPWFLPASQSTLQPAASTRPPPSGGPKCHLEQHLSSWYSLFWQKWPKGQRQGEASEMLSITLDLSRRLLALGEQGEAEVWLSHNIWSRCLINGWKLDVPELMRKGSGKAKGWDSKAAHRRIAL